MAIRFAYLKSRETLGDSGEKTVDLTPRDPITGIWVEVRVTNGGTSNKANLVAQCISEVEVIDGAEKLFSLNGQQALAHSAYHLGKLPQMLIDELASNVQNCPLWIPFGNYFGDPEYALDPTKHTVPQVRIKWNLAAVRAVAATAFLTGSASLSVVPAIMEGARAPRGYLSTKQHYTSAGAASGVDYVDLPLDLPYKELYIRAYKAQVQAYGVVSNVKLNVDANRYVPFDMRMTDLVRFWSQFGPRFNYRHSFYAVNGDTIYGIPKWEETLGALACNRADTVIQFTHVGYGEGVVNIHSAGGAQTGLTRILTDVAGYLPFGVLKIPFGDPRDPSQWFQAPSFGSVKLELTQAVASSTIELALTQPKTY